jgi:hypothetical protein
MSHGDGRPERRDASIPGKWQRTQFEFSSKQIAAFGFSEQVVEYCRQRARETKRLPHEILIDMVETAVRAHLPTSSTR